MDNRMDNKMDLRIDEGMFHDCGQASPFAMTRKLHSHGQESWGSL